MICISSKLSITQKRKKFSFFYTFLICGMIFLAFNKNIVYISFLPLLLLFIIKNGLKEKAMMFIVIFFYISLLFLFGQYSLFNKFAAWLELSFDFSPRDKIFSFIESNYDSDVARFINLVIFNRKNFETTFFYSKTIKLGIAWIICVSGFHLQLIKKVILFITPRENKIIGNVICGMFLMFYAYMINFSYSSMRVVFQFIFSHFFHKNKINKIESLGFIGILICILNSNCFINFSFILMMISCYGIYFILSLEIDNLFIRKFLISLYVNLLNLPILSLINNSISIMLIINSFVFSYIFPFVYVYFLIFMWIPIFTIIHEKIIFFTNFLINSFLEINYVIFLPRFNDWQIVTYLMIAIISSKIIHEKIIYKYIIYQ